MRYRKLDENGDYILGRGRGEFLINSPEAVVQAVLTRLRLIEGEWFLNVAEGVPYLTDILGYGNMLKYDFAIQETIKNTQGVSNIDEYASYYNSQTRQVTITASISTIYGTTTVGAIL